MAGGAAGSKEAATAVQSVAFTADEKRRLRLAAAMREQSVSAFVRAAAVKEAAKVLSVAKAA